MLTRDGDVFVLDLGATENRLSPDLLDALDAALDEVQATPATALVTTGSGKQYSSGLDLEWMSAHREQSGAYLARVHALLARVLVFPAYAVAAVPGHCFAAGAMLAAAHDWRVARQDRGWWCLPEVDLGMPFTPGMTALLQATLPGPALRAAAVTGARLTGPEAVALGVVEQAVPADQVLAVAVERAARWAGKDRDAVQQLKRCLYGAAEQALRTG